MTAAPHEVDCHGCDCDHHTHIPDEFGSCYEFCDACAAKLREDADAMRAEWEQWLADGRPLG